MSHTHKRSLRRWLKGLFLRHVHQMITCKEFEDFVLRYLDDELSTNQKSVFELHLRLCRECREYLAAYERSREITCAISALPNESVPQEVPEDLIKAILDAREH